MLQDDDAKAVLAKLELVNDSLVLLGSRLKDVTKAIDNATEQSRKNAEASGKLAENLNLYTYALVGATILLVVINFLQMMQHH